jgi:HAE1 family hydrophobic/amphiphilic exporter-1
VSFLTGIALRRRPVTILAILLVLVGGVITYRGLQVELFPDIDFPLITIFTLYPSANPEAVVRDVTEPIEEAIQGISGLDEIQSTSSENLSLVLARFKIGTDMAEAERTVASNIARVSLPSGVEDSTIQRVNPEEFPVLQLAVLGERGSSRLQRIVDSRIVPAISAVDGVSEVDVSGAIEEELVVTVDPDKLSRLGISLAQVSNALASNNVSIPAGAIIEGSRTFPIRTVNEYTSMADLRDLVVGFDNNSPRARASGAGPPSAANGPPTSSTGRPVLLSDVAEMRLSPEVATSISRTNGAPSLGLAIKKDPDANTVEVTRNVLEAVALLDDLPPDVQVVTFFNYGPEIQAQIDTLLGEGAWGLVFAVTLVFAFLFTLRPTIARGIQLTLRPTLVVGMAIPLSVLSGVLLMGAFGMSLNMMTLGGLAISVGRVVDDAIVVLENLYRHLQRGGDRVQTALESTREVAPAIITSTLTTIAVFIPLGFIQGLVGEFFLPFALTVSFALLASTLIALTAVPVLGSLLLRRGETVATGSDQAGGIAPDTWMQRAYMPMLLWALRHKAATLLTGFGLTAASLLLLFVIPITLFPSGGVRFLDIQMELPLGTTIERTLVQVQPIEARLERLRRQGVVDIYITTVGVNTNAVGFGGIAGGANLASILVRLAEDAPEDIAETLRSELASRDGRTITVADLNTDGPPESGLEMTISGDNYADISMAAGQIELALSRLDGLLNVKSDVTEARDEFVISVDPREAAELGLSVRDVAMQVNLYLVGREVTTVDGGGATSTVVQRAPEEDIEDIRVVLKALPERVDTLGKVKAITIAGPLGSAPLSDLAVVALAKGPVSISRTDGQRSASITGAITGKDTQEVGRAVQAVVDSLDLPPGVDVGSGGAFQDVAEGFQDIGMAMVIGIVLVYLVMVASLGALRDPFIILTSLPLAIIGALASLAITGRTLGLPAMMGLLLLIGVVVANAIVLIYFVSQLRARGLGVHESLLEAGRVRLRPILMTAFTTGFALLPLAAFVSAEGGIIGAELATVVIGGLITSTFLTLIVVPVVYTIMHESIPGLLRRVAARVVPTAPGIAAAQGPGDGGG